MSYYTTLVIFTEKAYINRQHPSPSLNKKISQLSAIQLDSPKKYKEDVYPRPFSNEAQQSKSGNGITLFEEGSFYLGLESSHAPLLTLCTHTTVP